MHLSPEWIEALADAGIEARHWSKVGDDAASDREDVFQSARRHGFVLLTRDLDFSRIFALAGDRSPSAGFCSARIACCRPTRQSFS